MIELLLMAVLFAFTIEDERIAGCEANDLALEGMMGPADWEEYEVNHEIYRICHDLTDEDALYAPVSLSTPTSEATRPGVMPGQGMGSDVEQWRSLVSGYFPADQMEKALCVMAGESGGNPNAKNPRSTAAGLWQFLRGTWNWVASQLGGPDYDSGAPYDPVIATQYAHHLWAQQGWSPWNAARRC